MPYFELQYIQVVPDFNRIPVDSTSRFFGEYYGEVTITNRGVTHVVYRRQQDSAERLAAFQAINLQSPSHIQIHTSDQLEIACSLWAINPEYNPEYDENDGNLRLFNISRGSFNWSSNIRYNMSVTQVLEGDYGRAILHYRTVNWVANVRIDGVLYNHSSIDIQCPGTFTLSQRRNASWKKRREDQDFVQSCTVFNGTISVPSGSSSSIPMSPSSVLVATQTFFISVSLEGFTPIDLDFEPYDTQSTTIRSNEGERQLELILTATLFE